MMPYPLPSSDYDYGEGYDLLSELEMEQFELWVLQSLCAIWTHLHY
jgi:hypothetical protein